MICEFSDMLGISFELVQGIFKDNVNMQQIGMKFISPPQFLLCFVHDFWLTTKWLLFHTLPIHQTFLYPKLKIALMGKRLNIIKIQSKLQEMCQASICALHEVI